ncbi:MAG: hypothetical protein H6739_02695 [Alphaproteobacteria bacterium]|nr:hypothetical protein [Alphaproteobacteria bacterium]
MDAPPRPPADKPGGDTEAEAAEAAEEIDALGPVLGEALERVFGVLRRQGRKRVGELARKGRERLDLFQARRDLDRLYQKLGRETVRLVEAGELTHPALQNRAERIRQQEELVREATAQEAAAAAASTPDPE